MGCARASPGSGPMEYSPVISEEDLARLGAVISNLEEAEDQATTEDLRGAARRR